MKEITFAFMLTTLDVRKLDGNGRRDWILLAPFVVVIQFADGTELTVRVPGGFITDFASVPRIPLAFMVFGGIGDYAAVAHDYLYKTKLFPREFADAVFQALLKHVDKTSDFRSFWMHKAVRVGGSRAYEQRT